MRKLIGSELLTAFTPAGVDPEAWDAFIDDLPEGIVRCKDCAYLDKSEDGSPHWCKFWVRTTEEDRYCSMAEMRGEQDEKRTEERTETRACDYISRQTAMAFPLSWEHRDKEHGSDEFISGVECYRDYIEGLPSAQQEQRWITVSERLPEENGRYLVTRGLNACGSLWNRIYIANYSDLMGLKSERIWWQGNVGKSDFERLDDVLAWMPLPEPYKGEEE